MRARTMLAGGLVALAAIVPAVAAAASAGDGQDGLAALRQATARFHDLDATLASGRVDLHLCFDMMGQHYADPATIDGDVTALDPEAMVYADDGTGHLRLDAVEWVATGPATVDFGSFTKDLHFNPAVDLWVLHAWIWAPNPAGMFADMNPRIGSCP